MSRHVAALNKKRGERFSPYKKIRVVALMKQQARQRAWKRLEESA
jgi:hypothetical protein